MKNIKAKLIAAILVVLVLGVYYYAALPRSISMQLSSGYFL